jgi:hypothetical protein
MTSEFYLNNHRIALGTIVTDEVLIKQELDLLKKVSSLSTFSFIS